MNLRAALLLIPCFIAATTGEAGRPLVIDDATPVARGEFEMEAGVNFFDDGPLRHWDFPLALAYGLSQRWEVSLGSGGQLEERGELEADDRLVTGLSDVILATKLKFADQQQLWADHALSLSVKLPTTSRHKGLSTGEVDYDLTWIASRRLTPKTGVHLNVGHTWLTDPPDEPIDDVFHYGLAFGYQFSERIEFVAETFANTPLDRLASTAVFINGGLRWQAAPNLVLDAAIGAGLSGKVPDFTATVGFTWSFGSSRRKNDT